MNWLLSLVYRWRDRRRPTLSFGFTKYVAGNAKSITFQTSLTNDGTKIARGVVVRGFLDGEQVWQAEPIDVPVESPPVIVDVVLRHPDQADLSPALNSRPIFHGRRFTATATAGRRTLRAEWPHEPELPPQR